MNAFYKTVFGNHLALKERQFGLLHGQEADRCYRRKDVYEMEKVTVIGAGSWGTAIAFVLLKMVMIVYSGQDVLTSPLK